MTSPLPALPCHVLPRLDLPCHSHDFAHCACLSSIVIAIALAIATSVPSFLPYLASSQPQASIVAPSILGLDEGVDETLRDKRRCQTLPHAHLTKRPHRCPCRRRGHREFPGSGTPLHGHVHLHCTAVEAHLHITGGSSVNTSGIGLMTAGEMAGMKEHVPHTQRSRGRWDEEGASGSAIGSHSPSILFCLPVVFQHPSAASSEMEGAGGAGHCTASQSVARHPSHWRCRGHEAVRRAGRVGGRVVVGLDMGSCRRRGPWWRSRRCRASRCIGSWSGLGSCGGLAISRSRSQGSGGAWNTLGHHLSRSTAIFERADLKAGNCLGDGEGELGSKMKVSRAKARYKHCSAMIRQPCSCRSIGICHSDPDATATATATAAAAARPSTPRPASRLTMPPTKQG
jgi:hypothetical protein